MLTLEQGQADQLGAARFLDRMVAMLRECGAVDPARGESELRIEVAGTLDEALRHGIATERLLGMYLLLRLADGIDPIAEPRYAAVLRTQMAEDDKAHILQMLRIGAIGAPATGGSHVS